jgi:4-oxalocrotonate tautomerase
MCPEADERKAEFIGFSQERGRCIAHDLWCRQGKSTSGRRKMPLVQVRVIEGVFSAQQKSEMIKKLTDAMVSVEGENMRGVTWVVIEEVKSGDWAIGGQPLTTEAVKAIAAGKSAA